MSEHRTGFIRRIQDWSQLVVTLLAILGWTLTLYKEQILMQKDIQILKEQSERTCGLPTEVAILQTQLSDFKEDILEKLTHMERKIDLRNTNIRYEGLVPAHSHNG